MIYSSANNLKEAETLGTEEKSQDNDNVVYCLHCNRDVNLRSIESCEKETCPFYQVKTREDSSSIKAKSF